MKIINIEGIDAVGKETVSKALEKTLHMKGFRVKRVEFPNYEGNFGKAIKDVLMGECGEAPKLSHELISPLYTLDRLSYFMKNIKDLFDNYDYVICDRSFYSNFMYQASKIYMKEPTFYNYRDIKPVILEWMIKNGTWEIYHTGLHHCEDIQTFVLSLSEEDSLKQLENRSTKDTNEVNRGYLSECKKFTAHYMSDEIKKDVSRFIKRDSDYAAPILKYYITNVHSIKVTHAENKENIPAVTMQTVNQICEYLGISTFIQTYSDENKKTENSVKTCKNKPRPTINNKYLNESVLACNMLCAVWHALKYSTNCSTSKIYEVCAEYNKGENLPNKIWYTIRHSDHQYILNPRFTSKIIADYMLDRPFPNAVRFIYIPVKNTFTAKEMMEGGNNED